MQKSREERRVIATEWLREFEKNIPCSHCGATDKTIDWHGEHHPQKPNFRVSSLRTQGASIDRIKKEIEICIPLCRSCHMKEDGRLKNLFTTQPRQKGSVITEPSPCSCCGKLTKPMRNRMCVTCDNHHSGRRIRKTISCDGCCMEVNIINPDFDKDK